MDFGKSKGRYYIGKHPDVDNHGKYKKLSLVAFENPKRTFHSILVVPRSQRH